MIDTYLENYQRSLQDPEGFWGEAAADLHWDSPYERVLDDSRAPFYRWFSGGRLNTCYNALDHHVLNGRAEQAALIYDSPVTGVQQTFSYRQLRDQVAQFAGALRKLGVNQGDRVLIYMPMIPEAVVAMLACSRIGAVHSVVFGGFASQELAVRIEDAQPVVIVTASCGIEITRIVDYQPLLQAALLNCRHQPKRCVVVQRPQHLVSLHPERDLEWQEAMNAAEPVDCVSLLATDPLYILYTSGTTGIPKGVVRDHGGHAVALKWSMRAVYGMEPGEVFWAASDLGWAVGHSYIVYAPLLYGCTTVLHEGKPVGTPDAGEFWRVISQHKVSTLFTAPTAFRAIKREDPLGEHIGRYDLSCFRTLFLAGERLDPDTYHWARSLLQKPVIDHWWQTETGWPVAANCLGLGPQIVKPGSPTKAVPGYAVEILDEAGQPLPSNREGAVVIKLPLPPGTLPTLWQREDGYRQLYLEKFPGYYNTGDGGYLDEDGYLFLMGRIDDVIIVSGHNLSTGSIEEALASHPAVAECAVFGVPDALKGQLPVGVVVLKAGQDEEGVADQLVQLVRSLVGPVANFKQVLILKRLPKTRSGKILRASMRKLANGEAFAIPPTIEDPVVLDEVKAALLTIGLGAAN
jgi:propionyl-CoA synthetase